jgi:hypothetical protein
MKILPLNQNVIQNHRQLFPNSCVSMSVEFLVKLDDPTQINYYNEQNKYSNGGIGGNVFDNIKINRITFSHLFPNNIHPRGKTFPLTQLFERIKDELDKDKYVQVSLESGRCYDNLGNLTFTNYHCWIIYGYDDKLDFLGVSKDYNNTTPLRIITGTLPTIKQLISKMEGTDIIIYR